MRRIIYTKPRCGYSATIQRELKELMELKKLMERSKRETRPYQKVLEKAK